MIAPGLPGDLFDFAGVERADVDRGRGHRILAVHGPRDGHTSPSGAFGLEGHGRATDSRPDRSCGSEFFGGGKLPGRRAARRERGLSSAPYCWFRA